MTSQINIMIDIKEEKMLVSMIYPHLLSFLSDFFFVSVTSSQSARAGLDGLGQGVFRDHEHINGV